MRGVFDQQDELLRTEQAVLSNGLTVATTNFSSYVSYLPNGMSQGPNNLGNGTFNLCLEHSERSVILSMTGRIRLAAGSC